MGKALKLMLTCILVGLIAACGGGGGSSAPASTVSGIAATGKALGNAAVTLIDTKAATKNATTSASGAYSIDVTGLTAPFVIKVDAGSGKSLYSFAGDVGTVNINPFSDLIIRSACGGANTETSHSTIKGNFVSSIAQFRSKFATMLTSYGVPSDYDPLSSSYAIGNSLDKLFDAITVTIASGTSVTITNTATGATIYTATITTSGAFGGIVTNSNIPTPPTGGTNTFSTTPKVVAGYYHSMALKADGTVWTWGNNDDGQIGDGTTTTRSTPVQVSGLSNVTNIGTGDNTPVALKSDGTVWVWGRDWSHGTAIIPVPIIKSPLQLTGISNVTAISAGHSHGVALKNDGTVWWWAGQIPNTPTPTQVAGLSGITSITSAYALKSDGTVWALNLGGTPAQLTGITSVTLLMQHGATNGTANQFALKSDGSIWKLGQSPTAITSITGLLLITEDGPSFGGLTNPNVALKSDNTVYAWSTGQPVQVTGVSGITDISNSGSHLLALKSDGTIWAWGSNLGGQLGDGTTTDRATPVQVSGLSLK